MAQLIPSNFDFTSVQKSEESVIRKLVHGLDDSWLVIPSVRITVNGADSEIDVVVVSFDQGALVIEVKGGVITVEDGEWKSNNHTIDNPATQVMRAKYALLERMKRARNGTNRIKLRHAVAFPHISDFPVEGVGADCPRDIVLTSMELDNISSVIKSFVDESSADSDLLAAFVKVLRPDVTEIRVNGRHITGTVQRLAEATADRLGPVIGLDENVRVYLRGGAGTGKTFVAMRWLRRALQRGESALYVCFNSPLADDAETKCAEIVDGLIEDGVHIPPLVTGNFHRVARRLMGGTAPVIPPAGSSEEETQNYWNEVLPAAFGDFVDQAEVRFDTIIIDEAQDFRPAWLAIIERLLANRDSGRLYMMADSKQTIYSSDWVPPTGITTLELTHNVRNSGHIARIVEHLGGAQVPVSVPPGPEVMIHEVRGMKEVAKATRKSLEFAVNELSIPLSRIVILVTHRDVRDAVINGLGDEFNIVRWQDREEDSVICETVHRTKGLERDGVIFIDMDEEPDPTLTYVGASRASAFLSVIGRETLVKSVTIAG